MRTETSQTGFVAHVAEPIREASGREGLAGSRHQERQVSAFAWRGVDRLLQFGKERKLQGLPGFLLADRAEEAVSIACALPLLLR